MKGRAMAVEDLVVLPREGRSFSTGRSTIQVKVEYGEQRSFAMFEGAQAPGVPGPPAHVHRDYDEAWYVLKGTMQFTLAGQTFTCPVGSSIFAPRGTAHTFMNPGTEPSRILAITTAEALPLVEELGQLASAGPPDERTVGEIMARHGTHLVRPTESA